MNKMANPKWIKISLDVEVFRYIPNSNEDPFVIESKNVALPRTDAALLTDTEGFARPVA